MLNNLKNKFLKNTDKNKLFLYLLIIFSLCVIGYFSLFITRGKYFNSLFHPDMDDTFMDHFHSVRNQTHNPYDPSNPSNYPPLACIFYKVILLITPIELRDLTAFEYRALSYNMMAFVICYVFIFWLIITVKNGRYSLGSNLNSLSTLVILFNVPMMFAIERGNIIIISFLFLLIYVAYYDSEKRSLRVLALISLAISAGLKLYPALFGLLLIKRGRYRDAVFAVIFGLSIFILPFFYYGFDSIKYMITGILTVEGRTVFNGFGVNVSFFNISNILCLMAGIETTSFQWVVKVVGVVVMVVTFFVSKNKVYEYLSLIFLVLSAMETCYEYTLIFLFIPYLELLKQWKEGKMEKNISDIVVLIAFALIFIPIPSKAILQENMKYPVTLGFLIMCLSLIVLQVMTVYKGISSGVAKSKAKLEELEHAR